MPTTTRNEALVKPELLSWARESSGYAIEEAAKKVPINPNHLLACEQGKARLTIRQLRILSNVYKRPLAFFFLPTPPAPEKQLHDYRKMPDEPEGITSPKLRLEIRKAKYRREVALDLYQELGEHPTVFLYQASPESDVNQVADKIRTILEVDIEQQIALKTDYEALNFWRDKIEEHGVLVFQASAEIHEMRGFSIWDKPLPIIVVNSKDTPYARVFSLLHEFAHLILRATGLCLLQDKDKTEVFCNAVAGAALVPEQYFLREKLVLDNKGSVEWHEAVIKSLASRYSVSREVILHRLLALEYTNYAFYHAKMKQWQEGYKVKKSSEPVIIPQHIKTISSAGKTFVRLVVDSYHQDRINLSNVSQYLGINVKHLANVEKALSNPSALTGELS